MFTDPDFSNPFPGLRAFEEYEDILFFGREKQIDELLRKLRTTRFLAVIGSSGSGKSSLVKSGLIPALHSGFMAGTSSSWRICTFRPGHDPIGNLASALSEDGMLHELQSEDEQHTYAAINESILRRSSFGLVEVYRQSGTDTGTNLLLIVDQFEELFRFSKYEKAAKDGKRDTVAFVNLLLKAVEQKELPIYIVFTMRSDFLGDCTEFRGLPEAINDGQYLVPRMTREERRDAIAGPVAVGGASISPGLLNLLLNDVGDNPDQLPILQHALLRTWDIWKKKHPALDTPLDIEDYEEIGTMQYALSQHAEEAYSELDTLQKKQLCELIFKALTDRGTDSRGIRRPQRISDLAAVANTTEAAVIEVVAVFRKKGRAFLMPPEGIPLTSDSIIDISHESLMRVWTRLINWVEEEGQSGQIYLRLCEAADQYELGKGGLWRDPELQIALKWREENVPNETWASRYNNLFSKAMVFLDHSKHQYDLELRYKEELQKQRLRRTRRTLAVISCAALVALFLAIYSLNLKNIATDQTRLAEKSSKEAHYQQRLAEKQKVIADERKNEAEQQKTLAEQNAILALKQKELAEQEKQKAIVSNQVALQQKHIAEQQKSIAVQQQTIAEQNEKRALKEQERAEEQTQRANDQSKISDRLKNLANARNVANRAMLLLNENRFAESKSEALKAFEINETNKGPFQNDDIFNALSRNWSNEIGNRNQFSAHRDAVRSIVAFPSGNLLLSADESGDVFLFKNSNGVLSKLGGININDQVRSIAVSPDGRKVIILSYNNGGTLIGIDNNSFDIIRRFKVDGKGRAVTFLNNHEGIVLTDAGLGKIDINDGGEDNADQFIPFPGIKAMCTCSAEHLFMAVGADINEYKSWNDIQQKNVAKKLTARGNITALSADKSGRYLAAGIEGGAIWLLDLKSDKSKTLALHLSAVNDLQFMNAIEGHLQLASASSDQTIKLVDVVAVLGNNDEDIITLRGHKRWVYSLSSSPDGRYLYSAGEDKKIMAWQTTMKGIYQSINH